jgi:predicted RNA-binding Zn-ribbon protein involved in translation (DUF1610 family)
MAVLSHYKRSCDICGREVDVTYVIVVKQKPKSKHLCPNCTREILKNVPIKWREEKDV